MALGRVIETGCFVYGVTKPLPEAAISYLFWTLLIRVQKSLSPNNNDV